MERKYDQLAAAVVEVTSHCAESTFNKYAQLLEEAIREEVEGKWPLIAIGAFLFGVAVGAVCV